jgi:hypothetical protein
MPERNAQRVERAARLKWVPIPQMKVSPVAQRELNQARVDWLAVNFDLEQLGTPTVNERDGGFYLIDGQHRIEALRQIDYGDQQVQCWCYVDLTDEQMADRFDRLNDVLAVHAFDKFRVRVNAGRAIECDIDRIVRASRLVVSRDALPGAISAVGTLVRVYNRAGSSVLARTLRILRDSFGDPGLEAPLIDGIGLLCQRYEDLLDEKVAIERLSKLHGGANGLLGKAEILRRSTGRQKNHCVAAAAIEVINATRGGKKLPSWWKQ